MDTKIKLTYAVIFTILLALFAGACSQTDIAETSQAEFDTIRADYRSWTALQPEPINVSMNIFLLCRLPMPDEMAFAESEEHGDYFLRDFINEIGYDALGSEAEIFPVGSIIVKEKFHEVSDWTTVDALGLMIKRDAGFNAEANDWEFLYWDEQGTLWQGIEETASCQSCHAGAERDFVFEGE